MTSAEIKQMRSAEIEEAAEVLSHAMHRNPIHVAVYQGESENERQQIEDAFSDLLRDRPEEVIMAKQGSQIIGVCRSLEEAMMDKLISKIKTSRLSAEEAKKLGDLGRDLKEVLEKEGSNQSLPAEKGGK